tara:strand:- start:1369 stop:4116 length:2748 start_codon:yes stop_codon:yes gene_type:complete
MPAVSQKVPNLLGGISQQPDPVKLPGQVRVADNVYLDPTFGCRKRPSTKFINKLASDVPADAKWFPIFRDGNERYAVAIYQSNGPVCRVWDLNNGVERSVSMSYFSRDYLTDAGRADINHLTVSDYTLLTNKKTTVTMSGNRSETPRNEAFVIINQVTYNTTYSVDVLKENTDLQQVKIYKATSLEVSPGSYTEYGGTCDDQAITPFEINDGDKQGLRGEIVNQCTPFLRDDGDDDNDQDSRYQVSVTLKNGGVGFRKGDSYEVSAPGKTFTIRVASDSYVYGYESVGTVNYTSPLDAEAGQLSVSDITAGLTSGLNGLFGYKAESIGNVIRIFGFGTTSRYQFNVAARGGSTNRAMLVVKGSVQSIADLPSQCFDEAVLKVTNTDESNSDDYYVKFEAQAEGIPGSGSWIETVAPGIQTTLNSSTMPQALIRQPNGNFTLEPLNSDSAFEGWGEREVGDETSNPTPSFVGKSISSMFFYANRMGMLADDSVILSQPGDYFNFFVESALAVSDADPIDLTASSTKPAFLRSAIGSNKGLILFADTSQFLLATTEIAFAASTVKMTEISNYYYRSQCPLLNTGVSVMFASESTTYSKVLEMAIDSVENRPQVAEITKNVPEFLPSNLLWGESLPNNSMAVFGDDSESVYVFKFLNNGGERQLAGWSTWTYPANIVMFGSEDDLMYLIMFDGTNHILVESELIDDAKDAPLNAGFSKFTPRLDVYVPGSQVIQTPVDRKTIRLTIPEDIRLEGAVYNTIVTSGNYPGYFERPTVSKEDDGWYLDVSTDIGSVEYILGVQYTTTVELPAIFVTNEGKADRVNSPQVSNLYLELYYSGRYEIIVNRLGYDPVTLTAEAPDANIYSANAAPIDEISVQPVPVYCSGKYTKVTITCPDPFPSAITGYSWEGTYHNRGIRAI